jgi:hypothetical protein
LQGLEAADVYVHYALERNAFHSRQTNRGGRLQLVADLRERVSVNENRTSTFSHFTFSEAKYSTIAASVSALVKFDAGLGLFNVLYLLQLE